MKSTDCLDFLILGFFYLVASLMFGEPLADACMRAVRLVGLCAACRGVVDAVDWFRG